MTKPNVTISSPMTLAGYDPADRHPSVVTVLFRRDARGRVDIVDVLGPDRSKRSARRERMARKKRRGWA